MVEGQEFKAQRTGSIWESGENKGNIPHPKSNALIVEAFPLLVGAHFSPSFLHLLTPFPMATISYTQSFSGHRMEPPLRP